MATLKSYSVGFLLSLALTLAAYYAVTERLFENKWLLGVIMGCAFAQFAVQIIFFLHLGHEKGPRWNLAAFTSTAGIVFIVLAGSLWIMHHLNYNMLPSEMELFLIEDSGIKPR